MKLWNCTQIFLLTYYSILSSIFHLYIFLLIYAILSYVFISETDECASNPCQNDGTCTDDVASFSCNCTDAWIGTTCSICEYSQASLLVSSPLYTEIPMDPHSSTLLHCCCNYSIQVKPCMFRIHLAAQLLWLGYAGVAMLISFGVTAHLLWSVQSSSDFIGRHRVTLTTVECLNAAHDLTHV